MMHSMTWLAISDLGTILTIAVFVFAGIGWVVNQIRAAQARQKAKQMQARAQMPSSARTMDAADRRRQKLQELARQRQQQVQEASGQRQANAQRSQQIRQQQAQRTQNQRAQAQRAQTGRVQTPTQRPQPQPQRPQLQRRQSQTPPPVHRTVPTQTSPPQSRHTQQPARRAQAQAKPRPVRPKAEEIIELTEIGSPGKLLGVSLAKAFMLKEVLDKPVAMRNASEHPMSQ